MHTHIHQTPVENSVQSLNKAGHGTTNLSVSGWSASPKKPRFECSGREKRKLFKIANIYELNVTAQITFHHVSLITGCLFPQFPSASRHNPRVIHAHPARNWVTVGEFSIKMKATCFIWHAAPLGGRLNMRGRGITSGQFRCSLTKWTNESVTAAAAASAALWGFCLHDKVKLKNSPYLMRLLTKTRVDCWCHHRIHVQNVQAAAQWPWACCLYPTHEHCHQFCNSFSINFLLKKNSAWFQKVQCWWKMTSRQVSLTRIYDGCTAGKGTRGGRRGLRQKKTETRVSIKQNTFYLHL